TQTGTVTEYRYNVAGRLVEVVRDGTILGTYTYDPFGRRVRKETADGIRYFVYAEEGLVAEVDGQGVGIRSYGFQPDGQWTTDPVFLKAEGDYAFYQNDHLGTPQKLFSSQGMEVWGAYYRGFGKELVTKNLTSNPLRFPGQYKDEEIGYNYNYNRFYIENAGYYNRPDPLGLTGGINFYSYAFQNPNMHIDPEGLIVCTLQKVAAAWECGERLEEASEKARQYLWWCEAAWWHCRYKGYIYPDGAEEICKNNPPSEEECEKLEDFGWASHARAYCANHPEVIEPISSSLDDCMKEAIKLAFCRGGPKGTPSPRVPPGP
ncbi:hypothetical protein GWN26_13660, partial [Candidatus Saccharibacteria bacterium]|nr:hypothetical protein [Calditrichia bacterium]NIV72887.1 hypothetical protein [Calditrichia bacterium]NIW00103.1 hypothetical protein [Candidatus Saccharibacteria bacterium]NIW80135.1 hypothetical protein [Calditrichia bacterium]